MYVNQWEFGWLVLSKKEGSFLAVKSSRDVFESVLLPKIFAKGHHRFQLSDERLRVIEFVAGPEESEDVVSDVSSDFAHLRPTSSEILLEGSALAHRGYRSGDELCLRVL